MAIYRFEAKVVGRAGRSGGRSVVASAAYRSGSNLYDEKYEVRHDYTRRQAGVVYTEILAPDGAPSWVADREKLWNEVERKEDESNRRASAQLAREFVPALPVELSTEQRRELVLGFVKDELVARGMVADVSIHESKDGKNPHAHVLCTMREVDQNGFGKKVRDWNDKEVLIHWREAWEQHCNTALEAAHLETRVDCRSLADQGIDREPQPKIGIEATAMERRGLETRRGVLAGLHAFGERIRSAIRGVESTGEVAQYGIGNTWWERAGAAIGHTFESAREVWRDQSSGGVWQSQELDRREPKRDRDEPDMSPG
jgi:ATP-dependent exoDNAse (exonuclease V) alpha subunit